MVKSSKGDIDAIFAKVKKPAQKSVQPMKKPKPAKQESLKERGSASDPLGLGAGSTGGGKKRRFTEEGWPIYSEEELKLNSKGGDTKDCPFDCDCCF
jgi:hypothetical protein